MIETTRPNILFVINPKAGKGNNNYEEVIKLFFEKQAWPVAFFILEEKNTLQHLYQTIDDLKPDIVTAVGGDGTISTVARKVGGTGIKLAILPAGSANGMARELNISEDITVALETLVQGIVKKIDVLEVNNILCMHLSDIGLNARLIKYFEEGNMRGKWGYAKVALKVFFRKRYMRVSISTPQGNINRKALMVVIANASKYGTGAVINPGGDLCDGLFEVVVIKQLGLLTLLKMWLKPKTLSPGHTEVLQAVEVNIQTPKKMHFQVDGEYIGKVQRVKARVLPAHLHIIVPPEI